MTNLNILFCILFTIGISACGGPARTETTTTSSHQQTESGEEISTESTETREVESDGSQTVESSESTQISTPAPE